MMSKSIALYIASTFSSVDAAAVALAADAVAWIVAVAAFVAAVDALALALSE